MRTLATVCAGLAVFSSIVSVHLWRELRVERQQNAALRTRLTEAALPGRPSVLPVQSAATTPAAAAPNTKDSAAIGTAQTAPPVDAKAAAASATFAATQLSLLGMQSTELSKDPEYRKAQLTQRRMELAKNYPGLAEELRLSEQEARQLFEIMAERAMNLTAQAPGRPVAEQMELVRLQGEAQTKAIRDLLGDARYTQYTDYQPTRAARMQASNMGTALASAGMPLNDAQSRSLATAVVAEDRRMKQEPPLPSQNTNPANPLRGAQALAEYQNRQAESYRRYLDSASTVLSAAQLETLRQQFEQQDAQRRSSLSRITEQLESAAGAAARAAAAAGAP
jgi:hypothetical protein